jgi:hypothetical protein
MDATAQKKFSCPACGAAAEWNPAKQSLVCPSCGTTSPAQVELTPQASRSSRNTISSRRFAAFPMTSAAGRRKRLRQMPELPGHLGVSIRNESGSAAILRFLGARALRGNQGSLPPESLVAHEARRNAGARFDPPLVWQPLVRAEQAQARRADRYVKGLYIPYWTFDAQVHADWTAESGTITYVTETYTDAQGKTQTRQVQKIRWEPSVGALDHFFDDELCPLARRATRDAPRIEPFPTKELVPYKPGFLSGWVVERYQIDLGQRRQRRAREMDAEMERCAAAQVPGDTQRNLQVDTDYSGQTFKHILAPVWLLTYNYGARNFQVVINGYTGAIAGKYPKSWIKITLAVLAVLLVAGVFLLLANR